MKPAPDEQAAPWSIGRLLGWTTEYLTRNEVDEPRLTAEVLLAHALECQRIELYAGFERVPEADRVAKFRELVKRAAGHEPFAYLVGEKEFYSLRFAVTPDVLIPRPETETLVEVALDHCAGASLCAPHVLDVGTGSGCIVIALLSQLRDATAVATDSSPSALEVAKLNAAAHSVAARVAFLVADGLQLPPATASPHKFDLIASNPPYVAGDDMAALAANIRDHEPHEALTDGADGLSFFRAFGEVAPDLMSPGGVLICEVGDGQAERAVEAVAASGRLNWKKTVRDRIVGRDRVIVFEHGAATSIGEDRSR